MSWGWNPCTPCCEEPGGGACSYCPALTLDSAWSVTVPTSLNSDDGGCIPCSAAGTYIMDWVAACSWRALVICGVSSGAPAHFTARMDFTSPGIATLSFEWLGNSVGALIIAAVYQGPIDCGGMVLDLVGATGDCNGKMPATMTVTLVTP